MKTIKLFIVLFIAIAFIGDFVNVNYLYAQTLLRDVQKKSEIVFSIGDGILQNDFLEGFEIYNDNTFFVNGTTTTNNLQSAFVLLVRNEVLWRKKVFQSTDVSISFLGDATVYSTPSESLLYATTAEGVVIYDYAGDSVNSIPFSGLNSKLVQRSDSNTLLLLKINNNAKAYLYHAQAGTIIDSTLVASSVSFIQSRFYEINTKSWFLSFCQPSNKTLIVKLNNSGQVQWQKQFTKTDRTWLTADQNRVYTVSDSFAVDYSYRSVVKAFNMNGDLMWSKLYVPTSVSDQVANSRGIIFYPGVEGGCTIVGRAGNEASYVGSFATTYDINGQLLWEKIFPNEYEKIPLNVKWNSKKELIIGGCVNAKAYIAVYSVEGVTTAVNDHINVSSFVLYQNYPNPFNPLTTISYYLPYSTNVRLAVYNQIGQEVAELVSGFEYIGEHKVAFNGNNLPSGVYFARLTIANNQSLTKKMLLLK
jgi:hypothetical protein